MSVPRTSLCLLLVALAPACATTPPRPLPTAARSWPAPPEPARIRWVGSFPDPSVPPPKPSFWRGVLELIVGLEPEPGRGLHLVRPFGIAAREGHLLVADPDGAQVLELDWSTGALRAIQCPKEWKMPMAVAVGPAGALFVADAGAHVVVRHSAAGCQELGAGALERPTGVAISGDRLYVVDPPRHAVVGFSLDGREVVRFGVRGEGEAELNFPTAIAATAEGNLMVVDALNFRVVAFSPEGRALAVFGQRGEEPGRLGRPKGIALDRHGRVYVTDAYSDRVQVFSSAGEADFSFDGQDEAAGFSLPAGIAIDGDALFVADPWGRRIQRFTLLEEAR